jgi:hypothetical protein
MQKKFPMNTCNRNKGIAFNFLARKLSYDDFPQSGRGNLCLVGGISLSSYRNPETTTINYGN